MIAVFNSISVHMVAATLPSRISTRQYGRSVRESSLKEKTLHVGSAVFDEDWSDIMRRILVTQTLWKELVSMNKDRQWIALMGIIRGTHNAPREKISPSPIF